MDSYSITGDVRRDLEESFVEERDLIDGVREHDAIPFGDLPGIFGSSFMLTVRRPLDLETAELRRVEVRMRVSAGGFEIFRVDGLTGP